MATRRTLPRSVGKSGDYPQWSRPVLAWRRAYRGPGEQRSIYPVVDRTRVCRLLGVPPCFLLSQPDAQDRRRDVPRYVNYASKDVPLACGGAAS